MEVAKIAENLGLDIECVFELLKLYIATTSEDLENAQTAIRKFNAEQVHFSMHSIKGASGNMGFTELFEIAKEIDDRAMLNSLDGIDPLVRNFRTKYEQLITVFEKCRLEYDLNAEKGL